MNKIIVFLLILFPFTKLICQYGASPDSLGTSAIHKDSSIIVDWATNLSVNRGYLDINDKNYKLAGTNKVNYGSTNFGIGKAQGNSSDCISLGDSGVAILSFASTIYNGAGPDFAVFENSFADNFLELAYVEVSSDGNKFVRFPSISDYPCKFQVGPYAYADLRKVNNLAGKYRQGYGTPFDLEELKDSSGIDISSISHIKLIDVIGSISGIHGLDSKGDTINDCYPTPFASGGFDLDGVGVMFLNDLGAKPISIEASISIYPNPSEGIVYINSNEPGKLQISDLTGKIIVEKDYSVIESLDVSEYSKSFVFISFQTATSKITNRIWVK